VVSAVVCCNGLWNDGHSWCSHNLRLHSEASILIRRVRATNLINVIKLMLNSSFSDKAVQHDKDFLCDGLFRTHLGRNIDVASFY